MRIKLVTCTIAAVLLLAACGSDNKSSTASSDNSTTTAAANGSGSGSTTAVVKTADSKLGQILTTPDGMTIYGFTKDTGGMSSCVDACAAAWPPVKVDSATLPSGLDSATYKVIKRADGTFQLVAGDWPLYTFANDRAAGDVNGQGVAGFFVVKPDGSLNKGDAAATATTATTMGNGY